MTTIDIRGVALACNAANKWMDDWLRYHEDLTFTDAIVYRNEIESSLHVALSGMFGNDRPAIRTDMVKRMNTNDITEWYALIRHVMDVFVYLISLQDLRYIAVSEQDYRLWRKEEDAITDPSDLPFL